MVTPSPGEGIVDHEVKLVIRKKISAPGQESRVVQVVSLETAV